MKEKKNEGNYFNPLPRKEGDKSIVPLCALSTHFNPLPRKEGDRYLQRDARFFQSYFNPLPRKEGDKSIVPLCALSTHFNPLPRKEGDITMIYTSSRLTISIHSLVKRETFSCPTTTEEKAISIHSLVKRETRSTMVEYEHALQFQSTPS